MFGGGGGRGGKGGGEVEGEGGGGRTRTSKISRFCSRHPRTARYLKKFVLQPLVCLLLVAVVAVPTILVFTKHKDDLAASIHRITCLEGDDAENESACLEVGCLWFPLENGSPPCYYPPVDVHGYRVTDQQQLVSGRLQVNLKLLETSATPVPDLKEDLLLELTEYGSDMFRVKITVPGESRYEPPVPLNLPTEGARDGAKSLFNAQFTLSSGGDVFALRITRRDTNDTIFDTSIGGLTYGHQFLQLATRLSSSSSVYGLGEHAHASFRHSFEGRLVWPMMARDQPPQPGSQHNLYGVHPVYYVIEESQQAHAVFWLNSNTMEAEFGPLPSLTLRSLGGVMDLFFMLGPTPADVTRQYTQLIGQPAMPPYWALGFQLCRYGYENTADIQEAVSRTRRHGVPQDVQYGDIDMMDRQLDFTVDPDNFAELPEYIRTVKDDGLRFVVILDPAINAELSSDEYPVHQRARDADVYIKWPQDQAPADDNYGQQDIMLGYVWPENRTAFPDFLLPATASWWADEILTFYKNVSFDGLWIDMNEPANFGTNEANPWNWPSGLEEWSLTCPTSSWDDPPYLTRAVQEGKRLSDKTLCMSGLQSDGSSEYRHYDVHNLYGWAQSEPTLRAVQDATGQRGLVISRSTFPSSGRWAGHWLGDNISSWSHLSNSIIGMLEFNLFGIPYIGADICGFFNTATEELCGRWMQLGAFYPFSRNHNGKGGPDQDPGRWASVGAAGRAALRTRYLLLPHLYTLHHRAHQYAETVVRALAFQFPNDPNTLAVDTQFLWGASLMVAPVLQQGASSVNVYFPIAGRWFDFYTGIVVTSIGTHKVIAASMTDPVPVFVNAGVILPTQRPGANTHLSRKKPLGLIVAPTSLGIATGELFWDDGEGIETFERGEYYSASFTYDQSISTITWTVSHPHEASSAGLVLSDVRVFAVFEKPYQILVDGARIQQGDWHYNVRKQVLELYDLGLPVGESFTISWSSSLQEMRLPCPLSYGGLDCAVPEVDEAGCAKRNCDWDAAADVACALPPSSSLGYTAGERVPTATGYQLPLTRIEGPALFSNPLQTVTFEVFQLSEQVLRVKFTDAEHDRYEVPLDLTLPLQGSGSLLYEVVVPSEGQPDQPFTFSVVRKSTGTVILDTSLGGLVLEDQFLSLTTLLASKNVYGLGENTHSSFRHRFNTSTVWSLFGRDQWPVTDAEVNLYGTHPFYEVIENDGNTHGVLLLNSNAMDYQLLDYPSLTFRTIGGVLDLFVFLGPEPEQVTAQYTALVGRPFMPPYWALGFQLSRYGYHDSNHMEEVVSRTIASGIPYDVQYADIDHMDRRMDFTLDEDLFGGLPQLVEQLHQTGMRFIPILDPAINTELSYTDYPTHKRALDKDVYIKWPSNTSEDVLLENNGGGSLIMLGYVWPDNKTAFPNWFRTETHVWWQDEIARLYQWLPFDGIWIDMNEPAVFDTNMDQPWNWPDWQPESWNLKCPESKWDDPPYLTRAGSLGPSCRLSDKTLCMVAEEAPYRHYDVHNLYGWAQAEPTLSAAQATTKERSVVISRSTFVGAGRWAGHWLGDNNSAWPDLHRSIIGMLEFNLFGIPYIGADICGFFNTATEELCGRWMQLGAFYPFSRNHNGKGEPDQDPGMWPDTVAIWSRDALMTRYRLLPYLYTLHYWATSSGATVVRSLAHQFPHDRNCLDLDDQFLWGSGLMISPVLEEGERTRSVYFPHGAWYDYYTGKPIEWPGEHITVQAPLSTIPLHVKGGSVLPLQEPATNTHLSSMNPMGILVALDLDRTASGMLFWDDLVGINTINNLLYSRVQFSFREDTLSMKVEANHNENLGHLKLRDLEFMGVELSPSSILVDGKQLQGSWTYDRDNLRLLVTLDPQLDMNESRDVILSNIWW